MLRIRLQRTGKRGQAYFRIIVAEHTKKPKGEVLELLGSYDPHKKELKVEKDRIEYWMSKGAQISPTVNNLLVNNKIWDRPKIASWKPKVKSVDKTPKTDLSAEGLPKEKTPTEKEEISQPSSETTSSVEETKKEEPISTTEQLSEEQAPVN